MSVRGTSTDDHIHLRERPLIVSDVDDVVLEFINPFKIFLESCGHVLLPRSFRLTGNIVDRANKRPLAEAAAAIRAHFEG